jgi:hypothetical protein
VRSASGTIDSIVGSESSHDTQPLPLLINVARNSSVTVFSHVAATTGAGVGESVGVGVATGVGVTTGDADGEGVAEDSGSAFAVRNTLHTPATAATRMMMPTVIQTARLLTLRSYGRSLTPDVQTTGMISSAPSATERSVKASFGTIVSSSAAETIAATPQTIQTVR